MSPTLKKTFLLLTLAGAPALAQAQVTTTGAFTGDVTEGFPTGGNGYPSKLIVDTSFGSITSPQPALRGLCALVNGDHCYIMGRGSTPFLAKLDPSWPGGSNQMSFNVDEPARAFGAYFAQDVPVGTQTTFLVFDQNGNEVYNETTQLIENCGWHWVGWRSQGSTRIARVVVFHTGPMSSLAVDDVHVSYEDPGVPFCYPYVPNSIGDMGALSLEGTEVLSENDLEFRVSGMPVDRTGVLMVGRAPTIGDMPLGGQGYLCIGGETTFVPLSSFVLEADGSRCLDLESPVLPSLPTVETFVPGETYYFQVWYRDYNPHPTSNTTNAVRVTFE